MKNKGYKRMMVYGLNIWQYISIGSIPVPCLIWNVLVINFFVYKKLIIKIFKKYKDQ